MWLSYMEDSSAKFFLLKISELSLNHVYLEEKILRTNFTCIARYPDTAIEIFQLPQKGIKNNGTRDIDPARDEK